MPERRCANCPFRGSCGVSMVKIDGGWEVRCTAGIPGGGKPSTFSEIESLDHTVGSQHGAAPRQAPLQIDSETGRVIGRSW